jgi:hypothetical protein
MKSIFSFLFLLATVIDSEAQDDEVEFGIISKEDLLMPYYEKDSTAAAIILFDKGETVIDPVNAASTVEKRHVRIKFFKKEALSNYANISLYTQHARVSKIKGVSHRYDKERNMIVSTPLTDEGILKRNFNKHVDVINISLPGVVEGSVIEYSYTIKKNYATTAPWKFQYDIPVKYSEYLLSCPFPVRIDIRGTLEPKTYDPQYKKKYKRWVMEEIPAFKAEPLMPHENIYRSIVNFRSTSYSWGYIRDMMTAHHDFGKILTEHLYLQQKVNTIIQGAVSDTEKIQRISHYIKQNIEWNGRTDYYADAPKTIFEKKSGTSGDINLVFGSMLKKAGLAVSMVLISTRDNGLIYHEYPSISQFNDVICMVKIEKDSLMLDATDKMLPYDMLPLRCLNYEGLVIRDYLPEWVAFSPVRKAKISVMANFTLLPSGELNGKLSYVIDGYSALVTREEYRKKGADEYVKDFVHEKKIELKKNEIISMEDYESPVRENYEVLMTEHTTVAGDYIYLNPYLALREESNPLTEDERKYPLDFVVPVDRTFIGTIAIPEGYIVDQLPSSTAIILPDNSAKYSCNIVNLGKQITITTRFQQNNTIFMQPEYRSLKELYDIMVAKKSEPIVLKKMTK